MRLSPRALFLSLLLLAALPLPVPAARTIPMIGSVENQALARESGCRFVRRTGPLDSPYIFISDTVGTVLMNLDGQDVRLRRVSTSSRRRYKSKYRDAKGDRFVELYQGGGATVRLVETITDPCRYGDTMCDLVEMNAVITVTKGERRETVRAVGGCGNGEP